jgi:hypothetical protein
MVNYCIELEYSSSKGYRKFKQTQKEDLVASNTLKSNMKTKIY